MVSDNNAIQKTGISEPENRMRFWNSTGIPRNGLVECGNEINAKHKAVHTGTNGQKDRKLGIHHG